jgi:hypothetical protein
LTGLAAAQETTGTISGRILDAQGLAVPGATVTVTGPQGSKTVVTDGTGRFNAPFLTPGVYSIKAELQGFKSAEKKDIAVRLGGTADIPITMEVGGLTETVEVTGSTNTIDTTTTTIGANLDTAQLSQIPVGRTFAQALYLTPGVSNSGNVGQANPSISGGTGLENQYVVDGANVTNTGYGGLGSYSGTFGSLGNATPYDFIKEIQVKTGGYEAEFGQATGGVVNVVTKSGTNQLRGSGFAYSQPDQLQGAYKQFQASNGSVNTVGSSVSDVGAEGGLPIVRNRLFFFGAIDPSWRVTTFNAPPTFPLARLGDVDRKRRTVSYAAKVTSQMGDNHRVDVSFFGDPSNGANGPQRTSALLVRDTASFSAINYGGHQQVVRYSGVMTNSWLIDATWGRSENKIKEIPSVNEWRITNRTVTPNIITGGIGGYEVGNNSLNRQYQIKSTNIFSGHQVKYGFEYYDGLYSQSNGRTGPTFKAPDGRQTATGASIDVIPAPEIAQGRIFRVTRANFNTGRNTPQIYWDFFVQDSWQVGNKLTVNPGLRYEQEKMSGTIIKDWELKNNWAPRIGVTYDASGDGRTKVYANYGRFYARIPNDLAARALSADDGFTRGDYFDAGLTQQVPEGVAAAGVTRHFILAGVGADTIDPKAKLTYTNEILFGVDREIMANTTFGVRYVFRNMPQVLEDIADCPMVAYELPQTSGTCGSVEYILTNPKASIPVHPGTEFLGAHFDDPVHKYNSLEFTLNRRVTSWSAMASYRYSRLRGNFEGFYRDDNGQSDPGISSLYDFPTNDPSYAPFYAAQHSGDIRFLGDHNGILPLDRPHQVKLYANRTWGGFNLGTGVNLSSGKPLTPMAANPNYGSSGEIPVAARGTGIQTIDGFKKRTPFESQVDLQAAYALRMAGERRVTLLADIFNLFNERRVLNYNQNTQLNNGPTDPDFGKPISTIFAGNPPQFQVPLSLRVGVRYEF